MIDFNRPAFTGREFDYIRDAGTEGMLCGDGEYTKRCSQWMMDKFHVNHVMLTTSCTHALEMAAHLCDIKPGDGDHAVLYICFNRRCLCVKGSKDCIC